MASTPQVANNSDVVTRTALGALRFVDAVTGLSITDGLSVIARVGDKAISAIPSARGVHLFHQLPGLSGAAFWDGETKPEPLAYEFNIEVRDTARRFLPTTFKARFPGWPETSPICPDVASLGQKVPLFSAPWRSLRTDLALIRGTLRVHSTAQPAAWALLRVYRAADAPATAVSLVEGVAGPNGEFILMFPWPKPVNAIHGSKGQRWEVRIKAWYDLPDSHTTPDEFPDGEILLPKLCSILKQHSSKLLATLNSNVELPVQEMIPGQTLILKTSETPPPGTPEKSYLYLNN